MVEIIDKAAGHKQTNLFTSQFVIDLCGNDRAFYGATKFQELNLVTVATLKYSL